MGQKGRGGGSLGEAGRPRGAILGPMAQKEEVPHLASPPRKLSNGVLGPSWSAPGRLLGDLGAVLGLLGPLLGLCWAIFGAILRLPKPIGSEEAIMPTTLIFPRLLKDLGILEGAVEGSKGTWIRLGAVSRPLGCVSEAILSHLELSWAILEAILRSLWPSWGHLGPKRTL